MSTVFADFEREARELFDLNVTGWSKTGVGDIALLIDWERDFPQYKNVLRNVRPVMRLGVTLPTGSQINELDFASMPMGADGSVTIPFGGGIHVDLGSYVQLGFDAQFWYIWGKTKMRRIKTSFYQTDLLLPTVTSTAKQHGIVQSFALKGAVFSRNRAYQLKWFYEYIRKGEDILTPVDVKYGYDVINDHSESSDGEIKGQKELDEFTSHFATIKLGYDHHYVDPDLKVVPQAYLFWRIGFNGSYANIASTVGLQISLDF